MRRSCLTASVLFGAVVLAGCQEQGPTNPDTPSFQGMAFRGRPLSATLTGAAEVPSGDPDGSGAATVGLNGGLEQVCFEITVQNIAAVVAAHIHTGTAGVNGGVVVDFAFATNGLDGCVPAPQDLIKQIRQTPSDFYVNVHSIEFPAGAVRGQLTK
jgi:hypothetical protein